MGVGLDWFKVSRTDNVQSGDTLTAGGDTFLLAVGVVRGWTADALEVDVTVTVCKQQKYILNRVSNRSAGMISSRFPGDIFTKIHQNLQFHRHLPGRVTNSWDHIDPVYPNNSSVKGHLPGIDSPNIN